MTEQDWLTSADPTAMFGILQARDTGRGRERKLRLFAVACCRRVWHLIADERSKELVETAERFAEGRAAQAELEAARETVTGPDWAAAVRATRMGMTDAAWGLALQAAHDCADAVPYHAATGASAAARNASAWAAGRSRQEATRQAERHYHGDLLRCLFGTPFRPPTTVDDSLLTWNGGTVSRLAQAIYEERAFDRLPILADALEEAGCTDTEMLRHLRSGGPHARGCWAVDLLLAKE
jgi:hypothetical protein